MKKIIALIIALVMCIAVFTGCGKNLEVADDDALSITDRFVRISYEDGGINANQYVYADKETGVVYWAFFGGYRAGITVLLNADGTPMRYDFDTKEIIKKEVND